MHTRAVAHSELSDLEGVAVLNEQSLITVRPHGVGVPRRQFPAVGPDCHEAVLVHGVVDSPFQRHGFGLEEGGEDHVAVHGVAVLVADGTSHERSVHPFSVQADLEILDVVVGIIVGRQLLHGGKGKDLVHPLRQHHGIVDVARHEGRHAVVLGIRTVVDAPYRRSGVVGRYRRPVELVEKRLVGFQHRSEVHLVGCLLPRGDVAGNHEERDRSVGAVAHDVPVVEVRQRNVPVGTHRHARFQGNGRGSHHCGEGVAADDRIRYGVDPRLEWFVPDGRTDSGKVILPRLKNVGETSFRSHRSPRSEVVDVGRLVILGGHDVVLPDGADVDLPRSAVGIGDGDQVGAEVRGIGQHPGVVEDESRLHVTRVGVLSVPRCDFLRDLAEETVDLRHSVGGHGGVVLVCACAQEDGVPVVFLPGLPFRVRFQFRLAYPMLLGHSPELGIVGVGVGREHGGHGHDIGDVVGRRQSEIRTHVGIVRVEVVVEEPSRDTACGSRDDDCYD